MKRRSLLRAGAAGAVAAALPRVAVTQPASTQVLRFVPQANLTLLDPIITTAAVTANHAWMIYDTLYGVIQAFIVCVADVREPCILANQDMLRSDIGMEPEEAQPIENQQTQKQVLARRVIAWQCLAA